MNEFISSIAHGTVPTPVAAGLGLVGLAAGLIWMRAAAADKFSKAKEYMRISVRYGRAGDEALARVRAVDTPTQQIDVSELRAAYATPIERLRHWGRDTGERLAEAIAPAQAEPDWEEGEMTAAFRRVVDAEGWQQPGAFTAPAEASPWVSPIASGPAPAPTPPPAIVHAPRGPQTPPRWQDGGTRPPQRRAARGLTPRDREWTFMGRVPSLELPEFPRPFQMPTPQQRLPHDPRRMAQLPADETRQWRTRTV